MKKSYNYFILSIVILILGIVFTISGVQLQSLPLSSKSALLVFSTAFIIIGVASSAVYYRKYHLIKDLCAQDVPIIARWTYAPHSSSTLKTFVKEQKSNTFATALLVLILALIFSIVFAYSGGKNILYLGYTFAALSLLTFIIAQRFISTYYKNVLETENEAIFGEDTIYFLDEIYPLQRTFYSLKKINIYVGVEHLLILEYGLYDIDNPDDTYTVTIPIPKDKLQVATYLKHYYSDFIEPR